jgi:micrococcal nuclease
MREFLARNKVVVAILVGAAIIGGSIYLSEQKGNQIINKGNNQGVQKIKGKSNQEESSQTGEANCQNIPELPNGTLKLVTKIIDGDTFLIEGGYSVRILGIDADERDHPCYEAAKNRLEELILNKEVKLEKGAEDKDQWCRYLRYALLGNENIGLELVKEGLAVARFSPEDIKYREEIAAAEKQAKENKIGCKWSGQVSAEERNEGSGLHWENLTAESTGLKVIGACQAGNYYGKEVIVEGKVASAYRSKTNTVFLNLEKPYPNQCFTSVIFSSDQYKFVSAPEKYYANKTVRIRGEIKEYQGKPEVILKTPSQIEIGK